MMVSTMVLAVALVAQDPTQPGFRGVLEKETVLAADYFAYLDYVKTARARDQIGFNKAIQEKKLVVLKEDTQVLVLKYSAGSDALGIEPYFELRVIDGPYAESKGWSYKAPMDSGKLASAVREAQFKLMELRDTLSKYRDKKLANKQYPSKRHDIIVQVALKYELDEDQIKEMIARLETIELGLLQKQKSIQADRNFAHQMLNMQLQWMINNYRPPRVMNHVEASAMVGGRR